MDWNEYIDSYCERLAPGLWGEPLNAISNGAFLIAAFFLWRTIRRRPGSAEPVRPPASMTALVVLLVLIGLGSLAFHTAATRWGVILDVGFIALFIHFYVVCYLHWFWGVRWQFAWIGAPVYFGCAQGLTWVFGDAFGNGSGDYLPAVVGMVVLGGALLFGGDRDLARYVKWFGFAAVLFGLSLFLRTIDNDVCASFPLGTHYFWHSLNACVLFLVAYAAVLRWRNSSAPSA